jgi:hypothetical protein
MFGYAFYNMKQFSLLKSETRSFPAWYQLNELLDFFGMMFYLDGNQIELREKSSVFGSENNRWLHGSS